MKLKCLFFSIYLIISSFSYAQLTPHEALDSDEIVFFGLDYSKVKLIGAHGFSNPTDIKELYFDKWNQLIVNESDKYDIGKAFNNKNVIYDFSVVNKRNQLPIVEDLVTENDYDLSIEDVKSIIAAYEGEKATHGTGLVFIVESYNKNEQKGHYWIVLFDIATKESLEVFEITGKAGGFGFRNYWARTIYDALKRIKKRNK